MTAVLFQQVSRHFGAVRAVDSVDLAIAEGEFFAMLGPSGSGKTTCLRLMAGFEQPTSGHIEIFGETAEGVPPYRRNVNTVFQDYALFPHLSILENVAYGLMVKGIGKAERLKAAEDALAMVKLPGYGTRRPGQLSGGQRQRVALARALVNRPRVLLLDEPLGALDLKLREQMQEELKSLQKSLGITFVFVTHDQEEALTMSDRIAVMSTGTVRQVGSPWDIYDRPAERFVADFIGETNFLEAEVVSVSGKKARVRLSSGAEIAATFPADLTPSGKVTIVVRPEHAQAGAPSPTSLLRGTVHEIVYLGTDTHFHVRLDDGKTFTARQQNARSGHCGFAKDDPIGITFSDDVAQILRD